jgi:hypothetical protein
VWGYTRYNGIVEKNSNGKHNNIIRNKFLLIIWLVLNILEGGICLAATLLIPADPQNAIFLGYSPFRLATLAFILILLGLNIIAWRKLHQHVTWLERLAARLRQTIWLPLAGLLFSTCVWAALWMPAHRFGDYEAVYVRLHPALLWVSLVGFQFILLLFLLNKRIDFNNIRGTLRDNWKQITISAGVWLMLAAVFFLLRSTSLNSLHEGTDFPPGAPLAPLQLLTAWLLCMGLFVVEGRLFKNRSALLATGILFVVIWGAAIWVWNGTPFTCTDDRIGPYAPNFVCYPESDDAVYTIGSHYTALGEGIYNHWMTDKPLYMVFLAIGQWITGPMIDEYLFFQLVVIALIPALLFLMGKKWMGYSGGIFLSMLSIFLGRNAVVMYQSTGSVNIRTENPELLTGLFLILLCLSVMQWFKKPHQAIWPVLSGGILGLSILARFNPVLIAPLLLCAYVILDFKQRKRVVYHSILFIVTVCLVICPWFLGSRDNSGQNFYLSKIQSVLYYRFQIPVGSFTDTSQSEATSIPVQGIPAATNTGTDPDQTTAGISSMFVYRFLSNIYLSVLTLPDTLTLETLENQVTQPMWQQQDLRFVWNYDLTAEDLIVFSLNLFIILTGAVLSARRFGVAGLSGIFIFLGYHAVNALAASTGGRYLEPVNWVVLLYFGFGLVSITRFWLQRFISADDSEITIDQPKSNQPKEYDEKKQIGLTAVLIGLFSLAGMGLLLVNNLPGRLPAETSQEAVDQAYARLHNTEGITPQQWQGFLSDPQSIVVEGFAYDPMYYVNEEYDPDQESYELLVLGQDHIVTSYLLNGVAGNPILDGSDVILVGCFQSEDDLWYAQRLIIRSLAVIQLDNEENLIVDFQTDWTCDRE